MSTYAELVSDIQQILEDDSSELENGFPTIFANTEDRIFLEVPTIKSYRTIEEGTLTASNRVLTPTETKIREIRYFYIVSSGSKIFLERRTDDFIDDYWPDPTETGIPKFYAQVDENDIILAPTPSLNFSYGLRHTRLPDRLTSSNTTTFLSTNYPTLFRKAAILEAGIFLHYDAERLKVFQSDYTSQAQLLIQEIERSDTEKDAGGI